MTNDIIPSIIRHPGELAQFPLNSNSHPDRQVDELVASRQRFSQYRNVVVWTCPDDIETKDAGGKPITLKKGVTYVLAGNGFHLASIKRGDEAIEVKDYSHLSLDEAILLAETDNAAPLGAERIVEQLRANLERAKSLYVDDERMSRMFDRLKDQVGIEEMPDIVSPQRKLGDPLKQIKPVLYADEIADFEIAITLTGNRNRGMAIMEICRYYIEAKTGQRNDSTKDKTSSNRSANGK